MEPPDEFQRRSPQQPGVDPESLQQDIVDELSDHMQCLVERELDALSDPNKAREGALKSFGATNLIVRQLWFDAMKGRIMSQRIVLFVALAMSSLCLFVGWIAWSSSERTRQSNQAILARLDKMSEDANELQEDPLAQTHNTESVAEIRELLSAAHAEFTNKHKDIVTDLIELQRNNPDIVIVDGSPLDLYAERFKQLSRELTTLEIREHKIGSLLQQADEALLKGQSSESVYLMLAGDDRKSQPLSDANINDNFNEKLDVRMQALREEHGSLVKRKLKLKELVHGAQQNSRKLLSALSDSRNLQTQLDGVQTMLTAYDEKLQEIDFGH